MSEWKTIDSPTWKEILKHRFFIAFNKDLYIEDLLNEIAKTISEQDQKLEAIMDGATNYTCWKDTEEMSKALLTALGDSAQNTDYVQKEEQE